MVFLLTGSDDSSADGSGPGDFTYDVGTERFTVHEVDVAAGSAVAFRASDLGSTKVAYGIARPDLDRLASVDGLFSDTENFTDAYSDSNETTREMFSDFSDLSEEQVALAETDASDVALQVRTKANPDDVTIESSDDYNALYSGDFYSDLYSEMGSDFSSDDSDSGGN